MKSTLNKAKSNLSLRLTLLTLTVLSIIGGSAYSNPPVLAQVQTCTPGGLVSWYRAENNALDYTSAHNGTLRGGTTFVSGKVGQAFNFDGVNDDVDLGNWSAGAQWTLEAWVRVSSLMPDRRGIFGGINYLADWGIGYQGGGTTFVGGFVGRIHPAGSSTGTISPGSAPTVGTWYHLAVTSDGTTERLYLDGVERDSAAVDPNYNPTTNGIRIGSESCCGAYFHGLVDEPSAYNRTLSASEIQAIFNAGSAGKNPQQVCAAPIVTKTADTDDGVCDADCSLREAIAAAAPGDTIVFSSLFDSARTITLTLGELLIDKNLTIIGKGARLLTISGNDASRVFSHFGSSSTVVNITGLTVANGFTDSIGGGIYNGKNGTLNLSSVTIRNNTSGKPHFAGSGGGGIANEGKLNVDGSTISDNTTSQHGGGIHNNNLSVVNISNSTITNNSSAGEGGGIFTGNGSLTLNNVTISHNTGRLGGGVATTSFSSTNVRNTIIALNIGTMNNPDVSGTLNSPDSGHFTSRGNNLIGNNLGAQTNFPAGHPNANSDRVGTSAEPIDPLLGELQNNGGQTDTRGFLIGSPAINNGNNCVTNNSCPINNPASALTTDQRGTSFPRQLESAVDIGAFELQVIVTTNLNDSGAGSFRQAVIDARAGGVVFTPRFCYTGGGVCFISLTSGEILINKSLTIIGTGALNKQIQRSTAAGTGNFRIFNITGSGTVVNISNLTIANGNTGSHGGGIAINQGSTLNLTKATVRNNTGNVGGGIINFGTLNIFHSTISHNTANNDSGGLRNNGTATIINSTFSNNTSLNNGGGILDLGGTLSLINATISHNTGNVGGGVAKFSGGVLNIRNTIIAANTSGNGDPRNDVFGTFTSKGNNLIGNNNGAAASFPAGNSNANGDIVGTTAAPINPLLGDLQENGGETNTHALLGNSPAFDSGNNCVTDLSCPTDNPPFALTTDQRGTGFSRRLGNTVDIGAFELAPTIVTNTNDAGTGSLRAAIAAVQTRGVIIFAVPDSDAGCVSGVCTINLTSGELVINKSLTIIGTGARNTIIQRSAASGTPNFRIFNMSGGGNDINISNLTIANGNSTQGGGGIHNFLNRLKLTNVTVKNNTSATFGGGIENNSGNLILLNSTVSNNVANSNNSGSGGIISYGQMPFLITANSTISGNVKNNGTDNGGGILFYGGAIIINSTITNNQAAGTGSAAGIKIGSGDANIRNTIIAANRSSTSTPDVAGSGFASNGNNLVGNVGTVTGFNQPGDQTGTGASPLNPMLGALQNNGGQTDTHALLFGSPAINAGNNCVTNNSCSTNNPPLALTTDQRGTGFLRQRGSAVDIGAFELEQVFVTNTNDTGTGSLRAATTDSKPAAIIIVAIPGSDVGCASGVCTIKLTSGEIVVNKPLTIIGGGARNTIIQRSTAQGTPNFRIFNISGGETIANISNLTIANGNTGSGGGGIMNNGSTLHLVGVAVKNNTAAFGGGIANAGILTLLNSTISNNTANNTGSGGGGIDTQGTLIIANSTISGNVKNNGNGNGGGILVFSGVASFVNVTITDNQTAGTGSAGGILRSGGISVNIRNTIIAANRNNTSTPDVAGAFTSNGNNLIGNVGTATGFTQTGDQKGTGASPLNPQLASLSYNGGQTDTHFLLVGSPAFNAGNNCVTNLSCPTNNPIVALTTDQRGTGFPRQDAGTVDIGAVERVSPTAASVKVSGRVVNSYGRGIGKAQVILSDANGNNRTVLTNPFGYYLFEGIPAGENYVFSINHKRYQFSPQVVFVTGEVNNLNFTASP
ncbi:MAG: carboxypeptidase regulatory-like domain-containing protein [Acidobacteriota bacterium]|nr:carboxypeptidase regulatory-like domain-containing protein [Acidobacteriota bacterium]